jgi:hypothetical protein
MAKTVSVVTTDDLDGSDNARTMTFGVDGIIYEIDLSDDNRARLEQAYIEHARRVSARSRRAPAPSPVGPRVDRAAVRAWAKQQGPDVSERGRMSADVIAQYEATH